MEACLRSYRSKDGDTVDSIAWSVYGKQTEGLIEGLLEANPGLADLGPILSAGLDIAIPDAPAPAVIKQVRLWG